RRWCRHAADHPSSEAQPGCEGWVKRRYFPAMASLSNLANVRGLQTLRPLNGVELHCLALGQAAKALARDRGVMDEHVRSALRRDETKPLCVVEPLHSALCHFSIPCVARVAGRSRARCLPSGRHFRRGSSRQSAPTRCETYHFQPGNTKPESLDSPAK